MSFNATLPQTVFASDRDGVLYAYYTLLIIGGQVALPLSLAVMFFTKTLSRRYPTVINLLVSWVIYTIFSLLLLYARQEKRLIPSYGLCLAQASLGSGGSLLVGLATLCLILQLWLEFHSVKILLESRWCRFALVCTPWVFFAVFTVIVAVYGARHPEGVTNILLFYCTIDSVVINDLIAGILLFCLFLVVVLEATVLWKLFRTGARPTDGQLRRSRSSSDSRPQYQLSLRIVVFTAYSLLSFIIFGINLFVPSLTFPYLFMATLPLSAFLVFGIQTELIRILIDWFLNRFRRKTLEPMTFSAQNSAAVTASTMIDIETRLSLGKSFELMVLPDYDSRSTYVADATLKGSQESQILNPA